MSIEQENDWIERDDGDCPVPGETMVLVKHRDGSVSSKPRAADFWNQHGMSMWHWCAVDPENDIIAYRIVRES